MKIVEIEDTRGSFDEFFSFRFIGEDFFFLKKINFLG